MDPATTVLALGLLGGCIIASFILLLQRRQIECRPAVQSSTLPMPAARSDRSAATSAPDRQVAKTA